MVNYTMPGKKGGTLNIIHDGNVERTSWEGRGDDLCCDVMGYGLAVVMSCKVSWAGECGLILCPP